MQGGFTREWGNISLSKRLIESMSDFLSLRRLFPIGILLIALTACARPPEVQLLEGIAQGTTYHVRFWSERPVDAQALHRDVGAEFARIDREISNYRDDSVISGFNANRTTESQLVGEEIVALVEAARKVTQVAPCYDLTIKPLFDLWGFVGDTLTIPKAESLAQALSSVGLEKLETVDATHLRKGLAELRVDLSSIGQGYSVGRVAKLLEREGIGNYLVEIGGELQTRGHKPGGEPWRVAVEKPLPGEQRVDKVITIARDEPLAVMTSGTYRHYFDQDGKRYSHILDARTGKPVQHGTVRVTVLHPDPTQADAWSTALLCLGREAGVTAANQHGIAALFVEEVQGKMAEYASQPMAGLQGVEIQ